MKRLLDAIKNYCSFSKDMTAAMESIRQGRAPRNRNWPALFRAHTLFAVLVTGLFFVLGWKDLFFIQLYMNANLDLVLFVLPLMVFSLYQRHVYLLLILLPWCEKVAGLLLMFCGVKYYFGQIYVGCVIFTIISCVYLMFFHRFESFDLIDRAMLLLDEDLAKRGLALSADELAKARMLLLSNGRLARAGDSPGALQSLVNSISEKFV